METRTLDNRLDWAFFDADERPQESDAPLIRPLLPESASSVWNRLITPDPRQRHPMLLAEDHWLRPVRLPVRSWAEVWNEPRAAPDAISSFLSDLLKWSPETPILFFWMKERVTQTPWAVFLRNWRPFLFDDEAPFLLSEGLPQVISFSPGGTLGICKRPLP